MKHLRSNTLYYTVLAILVVGIALNFIRMDYYVTTPGSADPIDSMLKVENGYESPGTYNLVTILVDTQKANIYRYLWAKYDGNPYTKLIKAKAMEAPDENQHERELRRLGYMATAQQKAVYIAFKAADLKPEVIYDGLLVINVLSGMPASKVLEPGDLIVSAEGQEIGTIDDLAPILKGLGPEDEVELTIKRDNEKIKVAAPIGEFPKKYHDKYGIGIIQKAKLDVKVDRKVTFDTNNIGGPSAGLMMTLALYEKLNKEDLSGGQKICGTGTINMDASVGPIGGIKQKVVASAQAGCHVFFAPTAQQEAHMAQEAAQDINTEMDVVPVTTFYDAVDYLEKG